MYIKCIKMYIKYISNVYQMYIHLIYIWHTFWLGLEFWVWFHSVCNLELDPWGRLLSAEVSVQRPNVQVSASIPNSPSPSPKPQTHCARLELAASLHCFALIRTWGQKMILGLWDWIRVLGDEDINWALHHWAGTRELSTYSTPRIQSLSLSSLKSQSWRSTTAKADDLYGCCFCCCGLSLLNGNVWSWCRLVSVPASKAFLFDCILCLNPLRFWRSTVCCLEIY